MTGETDLAILLQSMQPVLNEGEYVFVSVAKSVASAIDREQIVAEFQEAEGVTLVLSREIAEAEQLSYTFSAAWITLKVHSSLAAVGLTAAFATALAKQNISCNVMAGYYHDHIFVSYTDADRAMGVLQELAE